jgi:hypothetical protein
VLQEYAGIDAERLERMEARLKADVLAEAGDCLKGSVSASYAVTAALTQRRKQRKTALK